MSATTAVLIQATFAGGTAVGVILAAIAYLTGTTTQVLAAVGLVLKAAGIVVVAAALVPFTPAVLAIAYNTFYRKMPAHKRGRHALA